MSDLVDSKAEEIRQIIAESYEKPMMVGAFMVIAEVLDGDGDNNLLSWWDGGSQWSRLGMAEWIGERMRQEIDTEPTDD